MSECRRWDGRLFYTDVVWLQQNFCHCRCCVFLEQCMFWCSMNEAGDGHFQTAGECRLPGTSVRLVWFINFALRASCNKLRETLRYSCRTTLWVKKTTPPSFCPNFMKYWPICQILSSAHSLFCRRNYATWQSFEKSGPETAEKVCIEKKKIKKQNKNRMVASALKARGEHN